MSSDIRYLLSLGVSVEEVARRAGRTVSAVQAELDRDQTRTRMRED
ncbi:hypothetical protein GCM10027061_20400 [Nesterenkonia suensis]